jgi:hypothetical protein
VIGTEALAAGAGTAAASLVTGTVLFGRARRRLGRTEADVRPLLFAALDRGGCDPQALDALTPIQRQALEAQARSLLPKLRGRDREMLGEILDRLGTIDAECHRSRSKRAATRARAGLFLGESGSPAAVRHLLELLDDPNPRVRLSAARGLGRLGHPSVLPALLASLEGPRAIPVDVVADAACDIRSCPVSLLRKGLESRSVPTRAAAVELLGRFQALDALDDVIELLQHDPSSEVRARAARALGRLGSPRAVDALLATVADGPPATRMQAIWALGEIGDDQAVPVLRILLLGPSLRLAEQSAIALAAMGEVGARVLQQVAQRDGQAATTAVEALQARARLEPSRA